MSNRTNGSVVRELEREFARYVGAEYAIACCNGTATLHTALVALGVQPGDHVAVPPLTMQTVAGTWSSGFAAWSDRFPPWRDHVQPWPGRRLGWPDRSRRLSGRFQPR